MKSDIKQAAQLAAEAAQPSSDLRGPAEYKLSMVKELTKRALTRARERSAASLFLKFKRGTTMVTKNLFALK